MELELLSGFEVEPWQRFVNSHRDGGPFHWPGWFLVLSSCFSVKPVFLQAKGAGGQIQGVLPLYRTSSLFTGRHLSTLDGGALGADAETVHALYDRALGMREELRTDYLLVRGDPQAPSGADEEVPAVHTLVDLRPGSDALWSALGSNTRRKVRKAEKTGFTVREGLDCLDTFYPIYAANVHRLGTPVQSRCMHRSMALHLCGNLRLFSVFLGERQVGGMLIVTASGRWTSLHVAVDPSSKEGYATYLLYWKAAQAGCAAGIGTLDLGRSIPSSGNHHFKQQWASQDVWVPYRYYLNRTRRSTSPPHLAAQNGLKQRAWSALPLWLANQLGPFVRRKLPFG